MHFDLIRIRSIRMVALGLALLGPVATSAAGTLDALQERGSIRLGHWPGEVPFSDLDASGNPVGYAIDLCKRVADLLEAKLRKPLRREWVEIDAATRFSFLDEDKIDLACADNTITRSRMEKYGFSNSIFVAGNRTITKKGSGIGSWSDLKGKRVAIVSATTGDALLRELDQRATLKIEFVQTRSLKEAWALLEQDKVVAVGYDDILLSDLAAKSALGADGYVFFERYLSVEPYGLVMRKEDAAFHQAVNEALARIYSSGEIQQVYGRWFMNGSRNVPMSKYLREDIAYPNSYPAFP